MRGLRLTLTPGTSHPRRTTPTFVLALLASSLLQATRATDATEPGILAPTSAAPVEVVVKAAARECFVSFVRASGYLVPRMSAVVMFDGPGFRLSEVKAAVGQSIARGDVVARAEQVAPPTGTGSQASLPIKSLASGVVLKRSALVGQLSSQGAEPLFTLAVDGEIEIAASVPGVHVPEIQPGQVAHVELEDGDILDGHIRAVPVTIDRASQMGEARITVESKASLAPGRFVRVSIEARRSCGLGVPRTALRRTATGPSLQIVTAHIVRTHSVSLGLAGDVDVEVPTGLVDGDLVVATAGSALRDGDRVRPITSDLQDAD